MADHPDFEAARERLEEIVGHRDKSEPCPIINAILATTGALAVLVDWPKLLEAGERAGRVRSEHTHGDPPNTFGHRYWRLPSDG